MEGSGKKLLVGIEHIGRCLTGRLAPSELYQQCISIICSHNSRSYHHSISFEHIVLYIGRCCPSIIAVSDSDSPPLMRSALGNPGPPHPPGQTSTKRSPFCRKPKLSKIWNFHNFAAGAAKFCPPSAHPTPGIVIINAPATHLANFDNVQIRLWKKPHQFLTSSFTIFTSFSTSVFWFHFIAQLDVQHGNVEKWGRNPLFSETPHSFYSSTLYSLVPCDVGFLAAHLSFTNQYQDAEYL